MAWEDIEMSENNSTEIKQVSNETLIDVDIAQSTESTMEQLIHQALSKALLNNLDAIVAKAVETAMQQAIQETVNKVVKQFNQANHSEWQEHLSSLARFKNFDTRGLVSNNALEPMSNETNASKVQSPCPDPAISGGPCKNPEPVQPKSRKP